MQSGKTGTFLRVALNMVGSGEVDNVFIVSGSADTMLRDQMENALRDEIKSFQDSLTDEDNEEVKERVKTAHDDHRFVVAFSSKLQLLDKPEQWRTKSPIEQQQLALLGNVPRKSLIIHDECHVAQSKENIPFSKFYEPNGLAPALFGDFTSISDRHIYILGVSATPFSEIVANKKAQIGDWTSQEKDIAEKFSISEKNIELMEPGDGYIGVKDFLDSAEEDGWGIHFTAEQIKPKEIHHHHHHIISEINRKKDKYQGKYLIIRTHNKCIDTMKCIASATNCDYKTGFPEKITEMNIDISENGALKTPPSRTTIVHICGLLRMGQVLHKQHVAMVYEQSSNPKADTILQGLLGRMCGYISGGAHIDVDIYISPSAENSVRTYADAWSKEIKDEQFDTMAQISDAMNLDRKVRVKNKGDVVTVNGINLIKTVPIRYNLSDTRDDDPDSNKTFRSVSRDCLVTMLDPANENGIGDGNEDIEEIIHYLVNLPPTAKTRNNGKGDLFEIYNHAFNNGERENRAGYSHDYGGESKCTFSTFYRGQVGFLIGWIPHNPAKHPPISKELAQINPKCNFIPTASSMKDDDTPIESNGGQTISLSHEISSDINLLRRELQAAVNRTTPDHSSYIPSCSQSIHSVYGKKTKGITLDPTFYTTEIISQIQRSLGVKFNNKTTGDHFIRFSSISWE